MNPSGEAGAVAQARAFELLTRLTDACVSVTSAVQETLTSGRTPSENQRQDLESAGWIAHCIAREIYHASGAFQPQQEQSQPDERVVSSSFCSLSLPIIEKLANVRAAGIAHHLVQTLVFLRARADRSG